MKPAQCLDEEKYNDSSGEIFVDDEISKWNESERTMYDGSMDGCSKADNSLLESATTKMDVSKSIATDDALYENSSSESDNDLRNVTAHNVALYPVSVDEDDELSKGDSLITSSMAPDPIVYEDSEEESNEIIFDGSITMPDIRNDICFNPTVLETRFDRHTTSCSVQKDSSADQSEKYAINVQSSVTADIEARNGYINIDSQSILSDTSNAVSNCSEVRSCPKKLDSNWITEPVRRKSTDVSTQTSSKKLDISKWQVQHSMAESRNVVSRSSSNRLARSTLPLTDEKTKLKDEIARLRQQIRRLESEASMVDTVKTYVKPSELIVSTDTFKEQPDIELPEHGGSCCPDETSNVFVNVIVTDMTCNEGEMALIKYSGIDDTIDLAVELYKYERDSVCNDIDLYGDADNSNLSSRDDVTVSLDSMTQKHEKIFLVPITDQPKESQTEISTTESNDFNSDALANEMQSLCNNKEVPNEKTEEFDEILESSQMGEYEEVSAIESSSSENDVCKNDEAHQDRTHQINHRSVAASTHLGDSRVSLDSIQMQYSESTSDVDIQLDLSFNESTPLFGANENVTALEHIAAGQCEKSILNPDNPEALNRCSKEQTEIHRSAEIQLNGNGENAQTGTHVGAEMRFTESIVTLAHNNLHILHSKHNTVKQVLQPDEVDTNTDGIVVQHQPDAMHDTALSQGKDVEIIEGASTGAEQREVLSNTMQSTEFHEEIFQKSVFVNLLNLDPWDKTSKLNESQIVHVIDNCPAFCSVKYTFEGFHGSLFPLSALCALDASISTIKKCYQAFPDAITKADAWVGTSLHYACSYHASLDVVEFLAKKNPLALKSVNQFHRLPLHM
jgi:hypothetical protein